MHSSRLAGFIIDCQDADLDAAATFWSAALGLARCGSDGDAYERLDGTSRDMAIEVQSVPHPSRVHLDIETDDVEAEADRIEKLGAKRVQRYPNWWVMEAPTGQRFCIVRARKPLAGLPGTSTW